MELIVSATTYNCFGSEPTVSLISEFLLTDSPEFGSAVTEILVDFHFAHSGPPGATLEGLYADFHAKRLTLPRVAFRRSRQQADIHIASDLIDGRDWSLRRVQPFPFFRAAVPELIDAVALLERRLTPRDDFDLPGLLAHCRRALKRIPNSEAEFNVLAAELRRCEEAKRDAMSPWEKLSIDWRDYHPDARAILDDSIFWNCTDDFAPHGNDTGADLLRDYRRWLRRHPAGDPLEFFERQSRGWLNPDGSIHEVMVEVPDEAAVALAFAEVKLRGACRPAVSALARAAIQRQRERAIAAAGWKYQDLRLDRLRLLESKLDS